MSNTTKPGSPETWSDTAAEAPVSERQPRRTLWLFLALAVGALALALVLGAQFIGVLYGLINPPMPPLPPSAVQSAHSSDTYGRDVWVYRAPVLPSEVTAYFAQAGAACSYPPFEVEREQALREEFPDASDLVALCEQSSSFSSFTMRWYALVSTYASGVEDTRIDLVRRIDWFGSAG